MISYDLIGRAVEHYASDGFTQIESPWLVSKEIAAITTPPEASTYIVQKDSEQKQKAFVASGEQSLLYLINKGYLSRSGLLQTVTPCMRNDAFDETHMKYFVKLELMRFSMDDDLNGDEPVLELVDSAQRFFRKHTASTRIINTRDETGYISYDIMLDDVEVGSYGYRSCRFCNWIYGTGLAEPRFSRMLTLGKRGN